MSSKTEPQSPRLHKLMSPSPKGSQTCGDHAEQLRTKRVPRLRGCKELISESIRTCSLFLATCCAQTLLKQYTTQRVSVEFADHDSSLSLSLYICRSYRRSARMYWLARCFAQHVLAKIRLSYSSTSLGPLALRTREMESWHSNVRV